MELTGLQGRAALVTGGTRGIGRGIAEALLAEGVRVVISGTSEEKGKRAIDEIGGDSVAFVQGDVRVQAEVEGMVDFTAERFGSVDILVNNAGGTDGFAMVDSLSDEAWLDALDMNVNAVFRATRRALHHMVPREWGRIINISSVEGKQCTKPAVSHYVTNKHAINGLTKAVACEYGPAGITCNAICPGAIETDLMSVKGRTAAEAAGISYEAFLQGYAEESMIKRLNTVGEVASLSALLASDAGGGITGALLNVDGGTAPY